MIAQLSGKLAVCDLTEVVVDVHGVGYAVTVPLSTFDKMPLLGEPVTLLIHTHVREDAIILFGFVSKEERELFRLLIEHVSGIGPRLALNVLSCMSVNGFCGAITDGDLKSLAKISGVARVSVSRMANLEPAAPMTTCAKTAKGDAPAASTSSDEIRKVAATAPTG